MRLVNSFRLSQPGLAMALAVTLFQNVQAGTLYSTDFSAGMGAEWGAPPNSTHANGVVRIAERGGNSHVLSMDLKGNSVPIKAINYATLTVDISRHREIKLSLRHHADHDPVHIFTSGVFQGFPDATGIALSSNGTDWIPLWSPELIHKSGWREIDELDVSSVIAANLSYLSPTGPLKIRFQHFMEVAGGQLRSAGRGWDDIMITGVVPEPGSGLLMVLGTLSALGMRIRRRR